METLNQLIAFLEDAESKDNAVYIPLDQLRPVISDLTYLRQRLRRYDELLAMQQKVLVRANRIFQRANDWPEYTYPDLSLLFDWLFDHCGRRQMLMFQAALEQNLEMLTDMGDLPLLGTIQVDGYILKILRDNLSRMLSEIHDLNRDYVFPLLKSVPAAYRRKKIAVNLDYLLRIELFISAACREHCFSGAACLHKPGGV